MPRVCDMCAFSHDHPNVRHVYVYMHASYAEETACASVRVLHAIWGKARPTAVLTHRCQNLSNELNTQIATKAAAPHAQKRRHNSASRACLRNASLARSLKFRIAW